MPLLKYNLIKEYILHTLDTFHTIDINQLLDCFFQEFPKEDKNSLARAVLEVKKDLEIRGVLKIAFEPDRRQFISLTKKYMVARQNKSLDDMNAEPDIYDIVSQHTAIL
jgi:hypothetical protein